MRKPTRGRRRRPGPGRAGRDRRQALNDSLDDAPEALKSAAQVQQGAARHRAARPAQADRGPREGDGRARHQRGAAQGLHHELQPHLRGVRRASRQPAPGDRPARADARERPRLVRQPRTRRCPTSRASPGTSSPASRRRPPTIAAVTPVDRRSSSCCSRRPSSAACSSDLQPGDPELRASWSTTRSTCSSRPTSPAAASTT